MSLTRLLVLVGSVALATIALEGRAEAACAVAPSPTHVCVTFDNDAEAYSVDDGTGPKTRGALAMTAGTSYVFEVDPADQSDFINHPFYISDNPAGALVGAELSAVITSGTLTFVPSAATPATSYYQCADHAMMGGPITVAGGAPVTTPDAGTDAGGHHGGEDSGVSTVPSPPKDASAPTTPTDPSTAPAASSSDEGGCAMGASAEAGPSFASLVAAIGAIAMFVRRRRR